ncbi:fimbria/pilus outer membrane usher protein [Pseudomonas mosselii]|uniref:Fimbria/pilus outer membrane usher protein n=1 Tax=Pseudomonas mosselii TaxID=78327 RepID=A0A7W2JVM1_9PSED|nr:MULTISPECIES: fimbria/pilus outer membrane usher protein [Pseudomonas]MBA6065922.1 fimbrial biogenesis outer membrane usher protein [Pseudomonas mosselii]MBS9760594.1 fimbrial biogenesis outer membrane usher protein [Pseudomonas mosselii]MDH1511219.1 fimbria/pilus outer membrane usher protein [Pseudomonas mosselii]MDH1530581.1 fimbria/pilus outer membrane usher protein [Pseudomonas mosselii]OWQ38127.1 fimbrial assembly protein [Pseudomonas sp. DrBHI1]
MWVATHRLCLGLAVLGPGLGVADELPPPPSEQAAIADATLYLDLQVNQVAKAELVPVQQRAGRLYLASEVLREAGIRLPGEPQGEVALDEIPGLHSDYDSQNQRLLLQVPPAWLPDQQVGERNLYPASDARSSFGALLNYDAYLNDTDEGGSYLAAWNELRLFDDWGTFSTTGQWRQSFNGAQAQGRQGFLRYDTTFRYTDEQRLLTYEAGDLVTGALPWTTSVRVGGLQLSRDFGARPDLVTYPLPAFAGEAAVPTSLDLFINGYKSSSTELQPGPYTLTNVPFINGAGEAVVVTTDALGRQVSTTLPFYVTSSLLTKGLSDFSVAAGSLRRDYAVRDFAYGPGVASATLRHGVSDYFTLETHAESAESLMLGGLGGNLRLGTFGVLNAALTQSRFEGDTGQQVALGYQYNSRRIGFNYQRVQRHGDYADLSLVDSPFTRLSQRSEQATLSLNLDRYGSLGAGYFDVRAGDGTRTRLINLSWSKPLWRNSSLYLSANREVGDSQWAVQAQLVIPFDLRGTLAFSAERSKDGQDLQRVNYSQAVPVGGGVGYNLGYATGGNRDDYRQADLTWRLQSVQLQVGAYGSSGEMTRWADASGSLVLMDAGLFAANRIDDAFVVVSTSGYADVPVRYENQQIGRTDRNGHLLVPYSSGYYRGKYEIDPMDLPADVLAPQVEQRVAVRRGSGYLLEFPLKRVLAASLVLVDADQQELKLGSRVRHQESGGEAVVGWDGLVYLENLAPHNRLQVDKADGGQCQVAFDLPEGQGPIPLIGPLECR